MRIVDAGLITDAIAKMCVSSNIRLGDDMRAAVERGRDAETQEMPKSIMGRLLENMDAAECMGMPACQDTGMAVVFADIGDDVHIDGSLRAAVDEGVRRGYVDGLLRLSVVADPLRRVNTNDNTPAILHISHVPGDKIRLTVAPKGFGSENMSAVRMFTPAASADDIAGFVVDTVTRAGANPCPPIVVGVGLGGDFEYAALLAKKALLRDIGSPGCDGFYDELERDILTRINELGIGPQGFGGRTTALAVHINPYPTHIAGLPCAVNIGCHINRHAVQII